MRKTGILGIFLAATAILCALLGSWTNLALFVIAVPVLLVAAAYCGFKARGILVGKLALWLACMLLAMSVVSLVMYMVVQPH